MNRQDVRVLKAGRGIDLALEALGAQGPSQLGMQQLECHGPLVLQIGREKDRGHPAPPELPLDVVAISQTGLKPLAGVCHRSHAVWEEL